MHPSEQREPWHDEPYRSESHSGDRWRGRGGPPGERWSPERERGMSQQGRHASAAPYEEAQRRDWYEGAERQRGAYGSEEEESSLARPWHQSSYGRHREDEGRWGGRDWRESGEGRGGGYGRRSGPLPMRGGARSGGSSMGGEYGNSYGGSYGGGYSSSERVGDGWGDYGGERYGPREQERRAYGRGDGARSQSGVGGGQSWGNGPSGRMSSHRGRSPKGYQRSDERIREDICDRLADDGELDPSEVEVRVEEGEVVLEGHVSERQAKHAIEDLCESVSGVKDVRNNLRVQRDDDGQRNASTQQGKRRKESKEGETRATT